MIPGRASRQNRPDNGFNAHGTTGALALISEGLTHLTEYNMVAKICFSHFRRNNEKFIW